MPLTRTQRRIIDYLGAYIAEHRYSPTYDEIAARFGYRSLATVYEHIRNLAAKGLIRIEPGKQRSIEILRTDDRDQRRAPVIVPSGWLRERADEYPVETAPEGVSLPLSYVRRCREVWRALREQKGSADELWTFCTPAESWRQSLGRAGYAIVREGSVVDGVLVWDQLSEHGGAQSNQ